MGQNNYQDETDHDMQSSIIVAIFIVRSNQIAFSNFASTLAVASHQISVQSVILFLRVVFFFFQVNKIKTSILTIYFTSPKLER